MRAEHSVFGHRGKALRDDFGLDSDVDVVSFDIDVPWSRWDLTTMEDELFSSLAERPTSLRKIASGTCFVVSIFNYSTSRSRGAFMYDTPAGVRVLQGPERRLFVTSLGVIVDLLRTDDFAVDIAVFDDLQRNQKIVVLHTIAAALLRDETPAPDLTAVIEGAVASVFEYARTMVAQEIELPPDNEYFDDSLPTWRELVLAAARELELEDYPHPKSRDEEFWDFLIQCLEGTVLWDNDFEDEAQMDVSPEASRRVRSTLGIPDNYFVAVPPDPSADEAETLLEELHELTRECR